MASVLGAAAALLVALATASVAFQALAYAAAAGHRRRHPPTCGADDEERAPWPARARAALAVFVGECAATALGLAALPLPGRRLDGAGERPVLVVAGGVWSAAARCVLARRLRRDGWRPVAVVRLPGKVDEAACRLDEPLAALRRAAGDRAVDVVAHGVAGLAARVHVRARGRESGVARLVTLGTPHQGTEARLGPGVRGEAGPGSPLLVRLAAADPVPALAECVSIYSADDALVLPPRAAYWSGALAIEVRGVGHAGLLLSRRVYRLVGESLAAAPEDAPRARRP